MFFLWNQVKVEVLVDRDDFTIFQMHTQRLVRNSLVWQSGEHHAENAVRYHNNLCMILWLQGLEIFSELLRPVQFIDFAFHALRQVLLLHCQDTLVHCPERVLRDLTPYLCLQLGISAQVFQEIAFNVVIPLEASHCVHQWE